MSLLSIATVPVEALLPPGGLALLALLVVLAWRRGRIRAPRTLLLVLLGLLVLLSIPAVSETLLAALDPPPAPPGAPPGAVVILSADVERSADGSLDIGALTLERERAGAALARRTGLPVLVTGGIVDPGTPVARLMQVSMTEDFGIQARWVEDASATTWENARFSAPMLQAAGINRVYLVTHAWHMRRSLIAFRRAGLDPVPVPVRDDPWPRFRLSELVPRASAWHRSYYALHEWTGLLWYSLRP